MTKTRYTAVITVLIAISVCVVPSAALPKAADRTGFDHNHTLFDSVLQKYVENGLVDYKALLKDRKDLSRYLEQIADIDWKDYEEWSRRQKLALWLNAYNAISIEVILQYYPIGKPNIVSPYPENSIRHIEGVWDKLEWKVAGRMFNLDHIEHVILRKELDEPKIHFVLVCASIGCPLLESRALTADTIETRLNTAADNYINRDHKVKVDGNNGIVWFPMIFDWFGEDFEDGYTDKGLFWDRNPTEKGLLYFIFEYVPLDQKTMLIKNEFVIKYIPYDWGLNEKVTQ
jgi:hypothetical protein